MAKESSFDVVSTVDMQEIDNAYQQAKKELTQRYDLKGSRRRAVARQAEEDHYGGGSRRVSWHARSSISWAASSSNEASISPPSNGATPKPATGQSVRQTATIVEGIDKETAGKINKDIKAQKLKVKVTIEGDKLRVSSASRDTLQEVIAFLKGQDYGQPLQYVNYR